MVAPVRLILPEPAVAVIVPPPQEPVSPFGVETTIPDGKLSVNATPVSARAFAAGFVMVNVNVLLVVGAITVGLNAFAITGGASTSTLAEAVPPVPPLVEVTWP